MSARGLIFFLILAVASALHLSHQAMNPLHEVTLEQSHDFLPLLLPFLFESAAVAEGAAAIGGAVTAAGEAITAAEAVTGAVTAGEAVGGAVTAGEAVGSTAAVGETAKGAVTAADKIAKDITDADTIATALAGAVTGVGGLVSNAVAQSAQLAKQKQFQETNNVAVQWGFDHFFLQAATPQIQSSIQKINAQQTVASKECSQVVGKCFARINELKMYQSHEDCIRLDTWCSSKIAK